MHSRRNLTILFVFALSAISMAAALAYDNLVSHPGLTEAAINLYQTSQNKTLSSEQTKAIIQGSVDEDADPRYLNHFYDPTTGQGLSGQLSARAWSQNQQSIIGFAGDYSEAAILKNYQDGDPTRAYQGIGHILHLIQDMSVPAHVRNDIHPNGDVYEVWVKQYGKINPTKYKLIQIENITNAFENIALATYQNFYS
ncbi:MAG: hypothetical protein WCK11_04675, partial [Candidatus Falkowbacteria bacterium]